MKQRNKELIIFIAGIAAGYGATLTIINKNLYAQIIVMQPSTPYIATTISLLAWLPFFIYHVRSYKKEASGEH